MRGGREEVTTYPCRKPIYIMLDGAEIVVLSGRLCLDYENVEAPSKLNLLGCV